MSLDILASYQTTFKLFPTIVSGIIRDTADETLDELKQPRNEGRNINFVSPIFINLNNHFQLI